ncbi:uncharacterized protein LOC142985419 [Anticarsia gemmatalis]|uniref:uncharacterized protein LOC142985419 n=1 Tax=Anticarsia gemmatalis TaxID=129554 RepID=UPI003F75A9AF
MSDDMFYCSFVSIHYIICECGETFPTEDELKEHLEKEHAHKKEKKEYACGICESIFNTEEACIQHYETSHIEVKSETVDEAEDDDDCKDDSIIIQEIYETPLRSVTIKETRERVKKDKKPKVYHNIKNIVCEVCGKRYASNAALKYHQRVHTGERPYKCTECTKTFTMPLFLEIHMRTHTGEKPYECSLCPKAFSNKAALLRHDRVHTGAKPYECPHCGKFFTQSNSMKLHVNTVHLKMPAPYKSRNRKIKAKERELMRNAILIARNGSDKDAAAAVETITDEAQNTEIATLTFVKQDPDIYEQQVEHIMYEDVDSKEITYEVVYEDSV